jgi:hypothetical protein
MKNKVIKYYIAAVFIASTFITYAQPGTTDNAGTLENTDPAAPIDSYLFYMALIGLFFIFMKFRSIQSKKYYN